MMNVYLLFTEDGFGCSHKITRKIENLKGIETADHYSLLVIKKTTKRSIEYLISDFGILENSNE